MSLPDTDEEVGEVDLNDIDNSDADGSDLGETVEKEDINDVLDEIDDDEPPAKEKDTERQRDPKTGKFVKEKDGDEEEEEEEQPEEEEEEEPDASKENKKGVPLPRFNKVIKERNALRAQLREQSRAAADLPRDPVADQLGQYDKRDKEIIGELDKLYESIEDLRAEGKAKDAAKVQREIDKLKDERADIRENRSLLKSSVVARQQATQVTEDTRYNGMVDTLRDLVPEFNGDSAEFDEDAVREFQFDVDSYIKGGMTPTAALRRAAVLYLQYDPFTGKGKPASKEAPAKKVTNIKRNVDRANRNPPDMKGKPNAQLDKLNADDLTGEQIAKLPEKERRKLLGDDL